VPGSHKFISMPSEKYIQSRSIQLLAEPGSVIFFDSLLWHRSGQNKSSDVRRGINHQYTKPFIKQQIDYPHFLQGKVNTESRLAQTLGFWSIPPKSVDEFRVDDPTKRTYRKGQG